MKLQTLPKEPEDLSGCIGHRIPDFLSHFTAEKIASGCSGNGDFQNIAWGALLCKVSEYFPGRV